MRDNVATALTLPVRGSTPSSISPCEVSKSESTGARPVLTGPRAFPLVLSLFSQPLDPASFHGHPVRSHSPWTPRLSTGTRSVLTAPGPRAFPRDPGSFSQPLDPAPFHGCPARSHSPWTPRLSFTQFVWFPEACSGSDHRTVQTLLFLRWQER